MQSPRNLIALLAVLTMTGCGTSSSVHNAEEMHAVFKRAVCLNLVPISGKSTDDDYTRTQVKRQNARVLACPPEWRRAVEP